MQVCHLLSAEIISIDTENEVIKGENTEINQDISCLIKKGNLELHKQARISNFKFIGKI